MKILPAAFALHAPIAAAVLALAVSIGSQPAIAQQYGSQSNGSPPNDSPREDSRLPALASRAGTDDGGIAAVMEAQAQPAAINAPLAIEAVDALNQYMDQKDWTEGWNSEKGRFMTVAYSQFNTEDPSYDPQFFAKREQAAKRGMLNAKAEIIRFINTEMSASEQLKIPGTDLHDALNEDFEVAERKLQAQQNTIYALMSEVDSAEAEALQGATTSDRINALLDAAIRKLDDSFDSGEISREKQVRYENAKKRVREAREELSRLEAKAAEMKGSKGAEFSSSVELMAAMPLIGATTIVQQESFNPEREMYQVAQIVCWSQKLEEAARATLSQSPLEFVPPEKGGTTLTDWLASQDLSAMVGPRQFLDDRGQRHFLGISSRAISNNATLDRKNRRLAEVFAAQMAAFSLYADVEAYSKAQQMSVERNSGRLGDPADIRAMESLEETLSQSFQNKKIQGLSRLASERLVHPLSGQPMHVVVYGISPESAGAAMALEDRATQAAIAVNRGQAFRQGRSEALQQARQSSIDDPAAHRAGQNAGQSTVRRWQQQGPSDNGATGAQGGVVGGDADVSDDF
ncbi:MAG: hypothetical protein RLY93_02750 [Sumerlaeia bacterium]